MIGEELDLSLKAFLDTEGVYDLRRAELEAQAYALIQALDSDDAEFAVEFLEALKRRAEKTLNWVRLETIGCLRMQVYRVLHKSNGN